MCSSDLNDALRLYGKVEISYPFETNGYGITATGETVSFAVPSIKVKELFTDFSFNDKVFFRFGKHAVKWGVGYFFSPADVINLGSIDPEDPTKDREGPVSLRVQIPFTGTQNNLYMYAIADDSLLIRNTAVAAKYEFVLGNTEIGVGGWYKYLRAPRLMTTVTSTLFGKIGFYGEVVGAYGTEEQWEEFSSNKSVSFSPVFQATAGFSYYWSKPKLSIAGQYFYNGFGASDPTKVTMFGPSGTPADS